MSRARRHLTRFPLLLAASACSVLFLGGCDHLHQDMATQPKYRPLSPSDFFRDGRSERPLLENTVARGSLANDEFVMPKDSNAFPLEVDQALLERGQERFTAFLHAVPRVARRRQRHGGVARHEASAELPHRPLA